MDGPRFRPGLPIRIHAGCASDEETGRVFQVPEGEPVAPTVPSWNQIEEYLSDIQGLRGAA